VTAAIDDPVIVRLKESVVTPVEERYNHMSQLLCAAKARSEQPGDWEMPGTLHGRNEHGATMVEMAIVTPLLLLLVFGILEFGLVFRDRLAIANGTQSAGRVAAILGNRIGSDMAVLEAIEQGLGITDATGSAVRHVQIWKSNGRGQPASACRIPGAGGSNCNWYTYDSDDLICKWDPCPDPAVNPIPYGGGYLPENRNVTYGTSDVIGVTVLFSHYWVVGILPLSDITCTANGADCWSDTAVFRIEPQNFGLN
jgi:hypothetical protein